jgi:hypothetical protein
MAKEFLFPVIQYFASLSSSTRWTAPVIISGPLPDHFGRKSIIDRAYS